MIFGYARVSTVDQTPALQIDALRAAGCERIVEERASGAQLDRPELQMMLKMMRAGDVLVVWRLDRLSRSLRQLVDTIEDLDKRGIGFKCTAQEIDTTTAAGRLVFHIFACMAEFERGLTIERVRAGMAAAKKRGVKLGGKFKLSQTTVAGARARVAAGESRRKIAREIGVDQSTLWRAMRNEEQYPMANGAG